ncbi:MAG TPA: hypothetical protein VLU43_09220 [Anaeromyxobacteraceae bacterium]|nr:hypothetical protein [Anaeromyxobacteraceae bacterium]
MVIVAVRDLVFRSRIEAAAGRLGVTVRVAPRGAPLAEVVREAPGATVLADLGEPGMLDEIGAIERAGGARVVGFLGHLRQDLMEAAAAAGADEILTRGQFVARLDDLLRRA